MRKSKNKHRPVIIVVLILVIFVVACGGYYFYELTPISDGSKTIDFAIQEGESYDNVLNNLEKKGLIRSARIASLYSKIHTQESYYAGDYEINNGMNTGAVLQYISNVKNTNKEQIKITVPEGKWAKEIAAMIAAKYPKYSTEEILKKWNDISYIKKLAKDYSFLDVDTLNNSNYKVKLEGYLFPDTYALNKDMTIDEITRVFLDRFQDVYETYKSDIENSGYSLQQILTLASIVQFESATKSDMKKIAGVFYNRLDDNMKLQSSVTVCYALYDDFKDAQDCEVNTDVDSPYNTYEHNGLPIGPILNPGEDAIDAVLHPTKSDYLYFVADINGDGKVYYSKTLEEHEKKMEELGLNFDNQ